MLTHRLRLLAALPLLLGLTISTPHMATNPPKDTVASFLTLPKTPAFPDWRPNYQTTIVIPKQQAEARQAATEAVQAIPDSQPTLYTTNAPNNALGYAQSLVDPSQWQCLYLLWNRESGWNPYAVNAFSGAMGIPQALGHGNVFALGDYVAQINWGLLYIRQAYGTPCNAWSHSQLMGWY